MDESVVNNRQKYLERINLYKKFGCDIEAERKFIVEKSKPFYGRILEIGTGKGYLTLALAREGLRFVSIDPSAEEQDCARMNVEHSAPGPSTRRRQG